MATKKTPALKTVVPSDTAFLEVMNGIIAFNYRNVLEINFDASSNKVTLTLTDPVTGTTKTGTVTLS